MYFDFVLKIFITKQIYLYYNIIYIVYILLFVYMYTSNKLCILHIDLYHFLSKYSICNAPIISFLRPLLFLTMCVDGGAPSLQAW